MNRLRKRTVRHAGVAAAALAVTAAVVGQGFAAEHLSRRAEEPSSAQPFRLVSTAGLDKEARAAVAAGSTPSVSRTLVASPPTVAAVSVGGNSATVLAAPDPSDGPSEPSESPKRSVSPSAVAGSAGASVDRRSAVTTVTVTVTPLEASQAAELVRGVPGVGLAESVISFDPFSYEERPGGRIRQDPRWVRRNIVTAGVPVLGVVVCHRLMLPALEGALREIVARGLDTLLDPGEYGGCWAPRHIDRDESKPLSMHAWGLAIDLDVAGNHLGQEPTLDPRIVDVFERWGFEWGGRWERPDGMHFELAAVGVSDTFDEERPTVTVVPKVTTGP